MNIPMVRSIMLTAGPSCRETGAGRGEGEERSPRCDGSG